MTYWAVVSELKVSLTKFQKNFRNSRSFQGKSHFQGVFREKVIFKDRVVFPGVSLARSNHVIKHNKEASCVHYVMLSGTAQQSYTFLLVLKQQNCDSFSFVQG